MCNLIACDHHSKHKVKYNSLWFSERLERDISNDVFKLPSYNSMMGSQKRALTRIWTLQAIQIISYYNYTLTCSIFDKVNDLHCWGERERSTTWRHCNRQIWKSTTQECIQDDTTHPLVGQLSVCGGVSESVCVLRLSLQTYLSEKCTSMTHLSTKITAPPRFYIYFLTHVHHLCKKTALWQ